MPIATRKFVLLAWLLAADHASCQTPSLTQDGPPLAFGDGLNPSVNPANGPGLVVTPEFMIVADQQAVSRGREGVVHILKRLGTTWTYWQTLVDHGPYAATNAGWFAYTLDLSGDWLAVGSTNSKGPYGQGDVQMFRLNAESRRFEFAQYIQDVEVRTGDEFGDTLSIDGEWMVIGAPWHDHNGVKDTGAIWFYELGPDQVWKKHAKVMNGNSGINHWLGIAVELKGHRAFASTMFDNAGGYGSGTVYQFQLVNGSWTQTAIVKPAPVRIGESFGACIEMDGDTLAITAPMRNSSTQIGAIYFFRLANGSWMQEARLAPPDGAPTENFGTALSLSHNLAVAGTKYADSRAGRIHVFRRNPANNQWSLDLSAIPQIRLTGDLFGADVFTDGTEVYATSPGSYRDGLKRILLYNFDPAYLKSWTTLAAPAPDRSGIHLTRQSGAPFFTATFSIESGNHAILESGDDLTHWKQRSNPLPPGVHTAEIPANSMEFFRLRLLPD